MAKKLTKSKAKKILHDKEVHGHPLTEQQRKFFGAIAGGAKPYKAQLGNIITPITPQASSSFFDLIFSAPQKLSTMAFTGRYETPSEAMNIENPYGAFVVNAILDPINLLAGAGILKSARKALAFKPNPEAFYRGLGKSGLEDALESKLLRTANKTGTYGGDLYMTPNFSVAKTAYSVDKPTMIFNPKKVSSKNPWGMESVKPKDAKSYIVEIPKSKVPGAEQVGEGIFKTKGPISIDDVKFYTEDWLRGYKQVKPPKKQNGGWLDKYDAPKAQNGFIGPIEDKDAETEFIESWMSSPRYAEMLKRSSGSTDEYNTINQGRLENIRRPYIKSEISPDDVLNEGNIASANLLFSKREYASPFRPGSVDRPSEAIGYDVRYNPKIFSQLSPLGRMSTLIHERSHTSDMPFDNAYNPDKNLLPLKDKELIGSRELLTGRSRYLKQPSEVRARLNELRFLGKQFGVYDPFTEAIDLEKLQKLNKKIPSMGQERDSPYDELKEIYTPEQIVELLNSVSKTSTKESSKAKNGIEGTMGGLTDKGFNYNGAWGGTMQDGGNLIPPMAGANTSVSMAQLGDSVKPIPMQLAMGGSLPGAVGFTYARTAGAAPANGPYAKKTKASAQNGQEMKYYQEGLDFKPKTISQNGSRTPIVVTDPNDPRLKAYHDSLSLYNRSIADKNRYLKFINSLGMDQSKIAPTTPYYGVDYKGNNRPLTKSKIDFVGMDDKGNTLYYAKNKPDGGGQHKQVANAYMVRPGEDRGWMKINEGMWVDYDKAKKIDKGYLTYKKPVQPVEYKKPESRRDTLYVSDVNDPRLKAYQDSLRLYNLSMEAKDPKYYNRNPSDPLNVITPSSRWFKDKENNAAVNAFIKKYGLLGSRDPRPKGIQPITYFQWSEGLRLPFYKKPVQPVVLQELVKEIEPRFEKPIPIPRDTRDLGYTLPTPGQFTAPKLYKYDPDTPTKFSFTYPTGGYNEQKTMYFPTRSAWKSYVEGIKGTEKFKSSQEGVDYAQATGYLQDGGDIPVDPMGYWNPENIGNPVTIPSNIITMEGVDQPLLGISDTGDVQYMEPGEDYEFDGEYVTEYPVAQGGKKVPIQTSDPKDPRLHSYLDSLNLHKAYLAQRRINPQVSVRKFVEENLARILGSNKEKYIAREQGRKKTFKSSSKAEQAKFFKPGQLDDAWTSEAKFKKDVPEDASLIDAYKALTFSSPTETGLWTTPDLYNEKIAPVDIYFGGKGNAAYNPVFMEPVQPVEYTGDPADYMQYRSAPTIFGSKYKFKPKSELTQNLKKPKPEPEYKSRHKVEAELPRTVTGDMSYDLPTPKKPGSSKLAKYTSDTPTQYSFTYPTGKYLEDETIYFPTKEAWKSFVEKIKGTERFKGSEERQGYAKATGYLKDGGNINDADAQPLKKLDQLLNFTNYNKPTKGGWLDKYN